MGDLLVVRKLFFTINASVSFVLSVCQLKYMWQFLLNGSNTARVFTFDDVGDGFRHCQFFLFDNFAATDNVNRHMAPDETENIKIQIHFTLNFDDVFFTHFAACGIFYDGNLAVQFIQFQIIVNFHASSGFDMIDNNAVFNTADI